MAVTNKNNLYSEYSEAWQEVRDCVKGNAAVKAKRTKYLPMLTGQTAQDYERYHKKVKFFGATGRALDGMHGNIFRKTYEQSAEVSDTFDKSLEDVDLTGTNIEQFASDIVYDALQTNWGGILVDYARGEGIVSELDAMRQGLKSYIKYYRAEDIINWQYKTINGMTQLALVVLREPFMENNKDDKFSAKETMNYRVLWINPETGYYEQELYNEKHSLTAPIETIQIKMNGSPMSEIPFYPLPGSIPEKPILYDLAMLNLQHYQDSADYQNGKHYTSIPTPIAIGLKPEIDEATNKAKPMFIGGTKFIFFPNEENIHGADVKFLEFTGSGMKALADGINHLETQMSILGAHIIASEKKGVESAEALRIHRIGENGVLAAFTRNISDQITKALRMRGAWNGEDVNKLEEWDINFNTDYDLSEENVQTLNALLNGRATGEIPRMSLYLGLKSLNLIPEQWDYETFILEVEKDQSAALPAMEIEKEKQAVDDTANDNVTDDNTDEEPDDASSE